jgi:hypothetical protein
MALNDFDYIKAKVRKITGRPSANQLSESGLNDYLNSFLVYDLPLHTRYFYNKQRYSFQMTPDEASYSISDIKNEYSNFEPPVYIDGSEISFYQDERSFYARFPKQKTSVTLSSGTAAIGVGPYTGTFSATPIEPGTVVISTIDTSGASLVAVDDGSGGFTGDVSAGAIDYETGAITALTFTSAVEVGETIYMSANNYVSGKPLAMLYSNNEFKFWPAPDRAYTVEMIAYPNPTASEIGSGDVFPELNQWADTIAFGTALKIFTDNLDLESYGKVQILFDEAKRLAERRTLKQLSTQRVSTIYSSSSYQNTGFNSNLYN